MKKLIFFITAIITVASMRGEEFITGGIFVSAASPDVVYMEAAKQSVSTNKLETGITYCPTNRRFELLLNKQQTVDIDVSNGISIRITPETTFFIDAVDQVIKNKEKTPAVLDADYSVSSFYLLEGEIYVNVPKMPENSSNILQTHLANILLSEGSFFIKATVKYVTINVFEGNATVVEPSGKENVIVKGNLAVIVPLDAYLMVANKEIEQSESTKIGKNVLELQNGRKNVLFSLIDGKIVGIRLK